MGQDKQQAGEDLSGKKVPGKVAQATLLTVALLWVAIFILFLWGGYLSWIGCAVGVVFTGSAMLSVLPSLAGKKRIAQLSSRIYGLTFLLLILAGIASVVWPNGNGTWQPYRFNEKLAALEHERAVADENNAAFLYRTAFAAMDMNDRPESVFTEDGHVRSELSTRPWNRQDHPDASKWIDVQSQTMARLATVGQMKQCRWPIHASTFDNDTVPHDALRHAISLLAAAGNRDLGEDRVAEAMTKYACLMQMADHLYQQSEYIDFLVGKGVEGMAGAMVKQLLARDSLPVEAVDKIAEHLPPATDGWHEEWSRLFQYEKLRYTNMLGSIYETNAEGDIRFAVWTGLSPQEERDSSARGRRALRLYWLMNMPLHPRGVEKMADRFFARMEPRMRLDYPLAPSEYDSLPSFVSLDTLSRLPCNFLRWGAETILFDDSTYERFHMDYARLLAGRRGRWLMLGLRKYRSERGAWPDSLDSISQYAPAEAFLDPISGEAFVYRNESGNFTLYSKGPNRLDEGGRNRYVRESRVDEDDVAIWPLRVQESPSRRQRSDSRTDANSPRR